MLHLGLLLTSAWVKCDFGARFSLKKITETHLSEKIVPRIFDAMHPRFLVLFWILVSRVSLGVCTCICNKTKKAWNRIILTFKKSWHLIIILSLEFYTFVQSMFIMDLSTLCFPHAEFKKPKSNLAFEIVRNRLKFHFMSKVKHDECGIYSEVQNWGFQGNKIDTLNILPVVSLVQKCWEISFMKSLLHSRLWAYIVKWCNNSFWCVCATD